MLHPEPREVRRTSTSWCLFARTLVAIVGLVVVPAFLLYGYAISTAWFYGLAPSSAELHSASSALMWARISASVSFAVVVALSGWLWARRAGALGTWLFCGLGIAVTLIVWYVDMPA